MVFRKAKKVYKVRVVDKPTLKDKVDKLSKKVSRIGKTIETKHEDSGAFSLTPDNAATTGGAPYRNISQGTADFTKRIGDKITVKTFRMRSTVHLTSLTAPQALRLCVFIYKNNPDAITTALSTIIQLYLSSTTSNGTQFHQAFKDWDNNNSFKTLYDKRKIIQPCNSQATTVSKYNWDIDIKIPKAYQNVQFVDNGTTVSKNELIFLWVAENDTGLTIYSQWRQEYQDA